jgi:hypothetical protein
VVAVSFLVERKVHFESIFCYCFMLEEILNILLIQRPHILMENKVIQAVYNSLLLIFFS